MGCGGVCRIAGRVGKRVRVKMNGERTRMGNREQQKENKMMGKWYEWNGSF